MLKGKTPLILAAVFALFAALIAFLAVQQKGQEAVEDWQPVKVIGAKRDLKAGSILSEENLGLLSIPRSLATRSVITNQDRKSGKVNVIGQKLAIDILKGDPLLYQHIATPSSDQHLAETVQDKGRAVSIRVSAESAVHHWVEPSDRVDILGVFRDPRTREMVSVTMLQNVIVLATGRVGGRSNRAVLTENELAYSTVTVHVLPEAVEMLVLAQDLGTLYLSLRNPEDHEIHDFGDGKTTMTTLLTGERSKRLSTRQNKIFKVEIIRGNRREQQAVP